MLHKKEKGKNHDEIIPPPYATGEKGLIPNIIWFMSYRTHQFIICLFSMTIVAVVIVLLVTIRVNYKNENVQINKQPTSIEQLKKGEKK